MCPIIIVLQINAYSQNEIEETDSMLTNDTLNYIDDDTILIWDENYKLQVTDFLSKTRSKKADKKAIAHVNVHIKVKICLNQKENKITFYVISFLNKNQSWIHERMKKSQKKIDETLFHEQVHFDITELYARKIRKEITKKLGNVYNNNKLKKLEEIIDKNFNEWDKHHEKFHNETRGFLDDEEKWYENLKEELKKLDKYKNPVVVKKYRRWTLLNLFIKPKHIEYVCDDNKNVMWIVHDSSYIPKQEQPKRKNTKYDFDRKKYKHIIKRRR